MTVLITGASRGLGYELSKKFYLKNYNLILITRKKSSETVKKIFENNVIVELDLLEDSITDKFDKVFLNILPDVIIHCAGSKLENDKHFIDTSILKQSMNINLNNPIELNNYFIEKAKENGQSLRIVHISSDAGITGRASPSYSISKGALNTYVKNAGRIYMPDNIMICAVLPTRFDQSNINSVVEIVQGIAESSNMLYSAELITITAGSI